ncbi:galactose oxidase precursor [Colletotrichum truncatum]|uniref:Galactose oxidase n=1 Tax=Colletotrichum truncatum TaxID=5467 RepID=A0ACC3Z235_COLTU|nr:galactose oxidase precursor [Colletotrichum truncatum]KAF6781698.1 galactose oxidase precursor [Colletotrichum truncatum]
MITGPKTCLAIFFVSFVVLLFYFSIDKLPPRARLEWHSSENPSVVGKWEPSVPVPLVPVAAAVLGHTGEVLLWSADNPGSFGNQDRTVSALYNPKTRLVSSKIVSETGHNMFCPGLSLNVLGDVFVTGGSTFNHTTIYRSANRSWEAGPGMTTGRGYHAQATLSNGKIFTIGGSWSGGVLDKNGEVFDPTTQTWVSLPGCRVEPMLTADARGAFSADNHPWLFAWKNESLFQAGPSTAMNWYGTGNADSLGSQSPAAFRGHNNDAMNGNAVMYDAGRGKILTLGGAPSYAYSSGKATVHEVTISEPFGNVSVEELQPMHAPRAYANSVVLPTGDIFVNGGATYALQWTDVNATWYPELWNAKTKRFERLARMTTPRTYHSVAVLLPDATVLTGGGGLCWEPCEDIPQWEAGSDHYDVQVFKPPYLFEPNGDTLARRPRILTVSNTEVALGDNLITQTDINVLEFTLIRYSSATHSINTDQRRIVLEFLPRASSPKLGWSYEVKIPLDPGIVVPGYWMLFAITSEGVPSMAKTLLLRI